MFEGATYPFESYYYLVTNAPKKKKKVWKPGLETCMVHGGTFCCKGLHYLHINTFHDMKALK